jgi:hypothetical protein
MNCHYARFNIPRLRKQNGLYHLTRDCESERWSCREGVFGEATDIFAIHSDLKMVNRDSLENFIRAYESQPCFWRI